mmetsp:Transcript_58385/g.157426  ORF Transcript_58385/g.157426 Transcript_58385/m.157426 type:complete len:243 (-) Transcript_58385:878-1606(-)
MTEMSAALSPSALTMTTLGRANSCLGPSAPSEPPEATASAPMGISESAGRLVPCASAGLMPWRSSLREPWAFLCSPSFSVLSNFSSFLQGSPLSFSVTFPRVSPEPTLSQSRTSISRVCPRASRGRLRHQFHCGFRFFSMTGVSNSSFLPLGRVMLHLHHGSERPKVSAFRRSVALTMVKLARPSGFVRTPSSRTTSLPPAFLSPPRGRTISSGTFASSPEETCSATTRVVSPSFSPVFNES